MPIFYFNLYQHLDKKTILQNTDLSVNLTRIQRNHPHIGNPSPLAAPAMADAALPVP
jgi:hypothetical protein